MSRLPTPLSDIDRRIPEAGRIRLGVKTAKGMTSIDTFRFTSPNKAIIEQIAMIYGGEAKAWRDPKASPPDQYEVITKAKEIDVYLPANALSVWYEMWSGGGVQRRCDGEQCQVPQTIPGGWEMTETPCVCIARGLMECRPYTRMNLILPIIAFHGVWRLETKGWNAAKELPGMVDVIQMMTQAGKLVSAKLYVERRTQQTPAGKRNFVVPGILISHSAQEMISGAADVQAITTGPSMVSMPAVAALTVSSDDDIIDAEIVDDEMSELENTLWNIASASNLDGDRFCLGVRRIAGADKDRIRGAISKIEAGTLVPIGFNPDGSIIWKK